jgi:hypothetical protein
MATPNWGRARRPSTEETISVIGLRTVPRQTGTSSPLHIAGAWTDLASGAIFMAASYEKPIAQQHDIFPDGSVLHSLLLRATC